MRRGGCCWLVANVIATFEDDDFIVILLYLTFFKKIKNHPGFLWRKGGTHAFKIINKCIQWSSFRVIFKVVFQIHCNQVLPKTKWAVRLLICSITESQQPRAVCPYRESLALSLSPSWDLPWSYPRGRLEQRKKGERTASAPASSINKRDWPSLIKSKLLMHRFGSRSIQVTAVSSETRVGGGNGTRTLTLCEGCYSNSNRGLA